MSSIRQEFEKMIVDPGCIGIAFFTHETLAVAWMFSLWSVFYIIEPTQSLRHKFPSIDNKYEKAEQWTNKRLQKMPKLIQNSRFFQSLNYPRLVTSGVESCLMRRVLSPITYPFKIGVAIYVANLFANYRIKSKNNRNTNNINNKTVSLDNELNQTKDSIYNEK